MDITRTNSTRTLAAALVVMTLAWATLSAVPSATNEAMPSDSISAMHARIPAASDTAEPAPTF